MAKHYIVKCDTCDRVVSQCRCPAIGYAKPVMYETCEACKKKVLEGLNDGDIERDN